VETLILDVGCADKPRGTVNLDLNIGRTSQLYFPERKIDPKFIPNFVQGHACFLPFRDNVFTKVLCYHTLEHLDDPVLALKEMKRVVNGVCEIRVPVRAHERFQMFFVPQRRRWVKQFHKQSFSKADITNLCGNTRYTYFLLSVLRNLKKLYSQERGNFLKFMFYTLGSTFFPPIPDEIVGRAYMQHPL